MSPSSLPRETCCSSSNYIASSVKLEVDSTADARRGMDAGVKKGSLVTTLQGAGVGVNSDIPRI